MARVYIYPLQSLLLDITSTDKSTRIEKDRFSYPVLRAHTGLYAFGYISLWVSLPQLVSNSLTCLYSATTDVKILALVFLALT